MDIGGFQNALRSDDFLVTVELLATRADGLDNFNRFLDDYRSGYRGGPGLARIVAITVPQSPGGTPTLEPYAVLSEVASDLPAELDAIAHLSCKDLNRNGLESCLKNLRDIGVRNILALTGDLPSDSKPVFELDSLGLLRLVAETSAKSIAGTDPDKLDGVFQFYPGAAINPYKYTLASAWQQYAKMVKKIYSGAEFLITQVGYDAIKAAELTRYLRAHDLDIPVFGNVFLLTESAARRMYERQLPGTYASEELFGRVSKEWEERKGGKAAMLKRCAQQTAFFRHQGFKGVHIGGMGLTFGDVAHIIEESQEIYEHEEVESYRHNIHFPAPSARYFIDQDGEFILPEKPPKPSLKQRFMEFTHDRFINPDSPAGRLAVGGDVPESPSDRKGLRYSILWDAERLSKGLLVDCRNCGDCLLPENYYAICNESACTKGLANIPCGDSDAITGTCGNKDGTVCAGELVFYAAFAVGKLGELSRRINSPKIAALRGTSAVMNYFSGIDHRGRIAGKLRRKKPINLIEIGESLHAQIPRIYWAMNDVLKRGDRLSGSLAYLTDVVARQIAAGADYIAINVDAFPQEIRPGLVRRYVDLVCSLGSGVPVCIDSSDPATKRAGLEEYYKVEKPPEDKLPIVNSISIIDPKPVLDLKADYDFKVVAMLHDRVDGVGNPTNVSTPDEAHELAQKLYGTLTDAGFASDDIFFDTAVFPIATDVEGTYTYKTMHGIRRIMGDPQMKGVHTVIGLSNCSHMMPRRLAINRAYLHVAMEHGLDAAVLDPAIDYGARPPEKEVLGIVKDLAGNDGSDAVRGFEIFERIAEYSRRYGKKSRE